MRIPSFLSSSEKSYIPQNGILILSDRHLTPSHFEGEKHPCNGMAHPLLKKMTWVSDKYDVGFEEKGRGFS